MCLQDSNLALHSEGIKMTVAAEQPHFITVDLDTGVVIYCLHVSGIAVVPGMLAYCSSSIMYVLLHV